MTKLKDLSGQTFGRWTVISRAANKGLQTAWNCICSCGTEKVVIASNLGKCTSSCGCLMVDLAKTHGRSGTHEYKAWEKLKHRCNNPNNPSFPRYGGRGITVCDRWECSFQNFIDDIGPRPSKKHSIERINNDLGYGPDNCKWATSAEQARNKSSAALVTAFGVTKNLSDWAMSCGIDYGTLHNRIYRSQMPPEEALTKPLSR